jgi:hypothetical protein
VYTSSILVVASIYNLLKLLAKSVTFGLASLARYRAIALRSTCRERCPLNIIEITHVLLGAGCAEL